MTLIIERFIKGDLIQGYGTAVKTGDRYAVAKVDFTYPIAAYKLGGLYVIKFDAANSESDLSDLDIAGLGAQKLRLPDEQPLFLSDIKTDETHVLMYNGVDFIVVDLPISTVPRWIKISKTHTDFQTTGLTFDLQLYSLQAGHIITGVKIEHSTAFAGTSVTAYTLSVGLTGDLTKYASAFDVFQAVGDTIFQLSNNFFIENNGSVVSIRAQAIAVGANLDQSTAGAVDIYVQVGNTKL